MIDEEKENVLSPGKLLRNVLVCIDAPESHTKEKRHSIAITVSKYFASCFKVKFTRGFSRFLPDTSVELTNGPIMVEMSRKGLQVLQ